VGTDAMRTVPPLAFGVHVLEHAFQFVQHALDRAFQVAAGLGWHHLARVAVEQAHAELLFQVGDMPAHRRLAQVQVLGRPAEMPLAGHRQKGAQLPQADIHAHLVSMNTIKRFDLSMGWR
jgi:hypothetical protein